MQAAQPPVARDYNTGELSRTAPPGGWLPHEELREAARRMAEAIAAEKWTEGLLAALKILFVCGGML